MMNLREDIEGRMTVPDPSIASHQHDGGSDGILKPMSGVGGVERTESVLPDDFVLEGPPTTSQDLPIISPRYRDMYPNHVARLRLAYLK